MSHGVSPEERKVDVEELLRYTDFASKALRDAGCEVPREAFEMRAAFARCANAEAAARSARDVLEVLSLTLQVAEQATIHRDSTLLFDLNAALGKLHAAVGPWPPEAPHKPEASA